MNYIMKIHDDQYELIISYSVMKYSVMKYGARHLNESCAKMGPNYTLAYDFLTMVRNVLDKKKIKPQ